MNLLNNFLHPQSPSQEDCGYVEISGAFNGDISNGMNVFVAPSGYVKGNIKTRTLVIAGKVQGNVEAHSLVIHSSGELIYNKLIYRELIVEDGGVMIYRNDTPGVQMEPPVSRAPVASALKVEVPKTETPGIEMPSASKPSPPTIEVPVEQASSPQPVMQQPLAAASHRPPPAHQISTSNKAVHFHSSF
jgi:hypothetical protein